MALSATLKIVMMALNAKLKIVMALNTKTKKRWWLWTPKTENSDGSELQNWKVMKVLNAKRQTEDATLNVDLKTDDGSERRNWKYDDGSERRNWERWWLWTPNRISDDGSERQTENDDGSERRNWEVIKALNAETENVSVGSEYQTGIEALNAKWKMW